VDEVRGDELSEKGGEDIGKEDDSLGDGGTDEVLGGREDDDVENVIDEACARGDS